MFRLQPGKHFKARQVDQVGEPPEQNQTAKKWPFLFPGKVNAKLSTVYLSNIPGVPVSRAYYQQSRNMHPPRSHWVNVERNNCALFRVFVFKDTNVSQFRFFPVMSSIHVEAPPLRLFDLHPVVHVTYGTWEIYISLQVRYVLLITTIFAFVSFSK